jgi:hypothetical protein
MGARACSRRPTHGCFHAAISPSEEQVPTLTVEQLDWLLEGIDIGVVQRYP